MADNPNVRGDGDRLRINVNQDHEVRCWSQKFDVSPEELRQAVRDIGTNGKRGQGPASVTPGARGNSYTSPVANFLTDSVNARRDCP